ncbi:nucleoside hydrolase [Desulfitobacterium sp. PCE1]|uniref:nucleoside hydrolase n=1 Tax=Desulfitobacterium sp. PCE1 TaxID=146907 RepID=UPI0003784E9A|nr:nucleoside hydrolase [Desulfitobacterium sp. PCE1]
MGQHKKVIFDCDNTMGIEGCDVDDGLALLYLLGEGSSQVCGITTTYGNNNVEAVYANTISMLEELRLTEIPVLKGYPQKSNLPQLTALESEASGFLVRRINENPQEISILATGSLTNLWGAYQKDGETLSKAKEIVIMGGITQELDINGKIMNELNLSCDPMATELVLKAGKNVSVITANNCLDAYFSFEEFLAALETSQEPIAEYILQKSRYWFEYMMNHYGLNGFYNWDVVAAVYLMKPELFVADYQAFAPTGKYLATGLLKHPSDKEEATLINVPRIKNSEEFKNEVYRAWLRFVGA